MEQPKEAARSAAGTTGARCQIDIDAHGGYGWRLVASNGRAMAVAAVSFASPGTCRSAFVALCAEHAQTSGGIQHRKGGGGWIWIMRDKSGIPVAASPRTYERHATCRSAYDRFRAMLPGLEVEEEAFWGSS
ncbi:hypothetical protein [Streptomyces sp. NBC_00102]|uniref:hypothetical protein n=1 Tax=Streptomyces sp. NBC_00102 TaxID=2975652 RepID=UPI002255D5B5|nr:hypothetical protein [Streptomyces sp. NBC_00102]MCX5400354.1 hypothetical protein [Streptomyces sp. NBC_00102]